MLNSRAVSFLVFILLLAVNSHAKTKAEIIQELKDNTVAIMMTHKMNKDATVYGTAFFIGTHFGKNLFITNFHVIDKLGCKESYIYETRILYRGTYKGVLGREYSTVKSMNCEGIESHWGGSDNSDIALITVEKLPEDFKGKGLEFDFNYRPTVGDRLLFIGNGSNRKRVAKSKASILRLRIRESEKCRVVSQIAHYVGTSVISKHTQRPVLGTFAYGCKTYSGDSGGPVVLVSTGKVIGLNWGGEKRRIAENEFNKIIDTTDVFKYSSSAISSKKLKEHIHMYLNYNPEEDQSLETDAVE